MTTKSRGKKEYEFSNPISMADVVFLLFTENGQLFSFSLLTS